MPHIDWMIKGPKIGACSCAYGCPCEFNARPTYGACEGMEAHRIDEGYFGDVRLDGTIIGARYRWPGPVHEGGGVAQGFIDERTTPAQREALIQIMSGKEQEPTTVFNIYGSTIVRELDLIVAPIDVGLGHDRSNRTSAARRWARRLPRPRRQPRTPSRHGRPE